MIKTFKKNNRGLAQYRRCKSSGSGFVILFAVTLASILLAIAIGVVNITYNETKFSTSAKSANDALFAADTGIEYVLFKDKQPNSIYVPSPGNRQTWNVTVIGLGSSGVGCAIINITKDNTTQPFTTTSVISKGYDTGDSSCNSTISNRVERELDVNY